MPGQHLEQGGSVAGSPCNCSVPLSLPPSHRAAHPCLQHQHSQRQPGPPARSGSFPFPFVVFLLNVKDSCPSGPRELLVLLYFICFSCKWVGVPGQPCSALLEHPRGHIWLLAPAPPSQLSPGSRCGVPAVSAPRGAGLSPRLLSVAGDAPAPFPCSENTQVEITAANSSKPPGTLCQLHTLERGKVDQV